MAQRARETAFAALFFFVLIAAATYPLGNLASPALPPRADAQFSVWRLGWVAHQLRADPAHLLDGNIFHPARGTLLFSDAMLLPAFAGAPFIWAGLHQMAVHNLLMVMALFLSALTCYALCRDLTGDGVAALFGGIVFALAPFRFAHVGHLELQWTPAMPLVLLLLHRANREPTARVVRAGAGAGVLLALHGLSSLYYLAFFGIFLVAWSGLTFLDTAREQRRRFVLVLATAAAVGGLLLAPYLAAYANARQTLGPRSMSEIQEHSAMPADYLRVSGESETYTPGHPAGEDERSLFPGWMAIALAGTGLWLARGRTRWIYAALALLSFDLSLGTNGLTYPIVLRLLPMFSSFRAPARFGILVLLSLAVLSSIGLAAVRARLGSRARGLLTFAVVAACVVEYLGGASGHRARATPASGGVPLARRGARPCDPRTAGAATLDAVVARKHVPVLVDVPLEPAGERLQRPRDGRLRGNARDYQPGGCRAHRATPGDAGCRLFDPAPAVLRPCRVCRGAQVLQHAPGRGRAAVVRRSGLPGRRDSVLLSVRKVAKGPKVTKDTKGHEGTKGARHEGRQGAEAISGGRRGSERDLFPRICGTRA